MQLSIRARLAIVVALSLLPVGLLAYLFVAQSQKDIAFASKEMDGARYLSALQPDLIALAANKPLGTSSELDAAAARYDDAMNTKEVSDAYGTLRVNASEQQVETTEALYTLVTKVGDGSNLILDPDLDSYYVMDLQVGKVPGFVGASAKLLDMVHSAGSTPDDPTRIEIVAQAGSLQSIVSGIEASYRAATTSNADGQIAANLGTSSQEFLVAAQDYLDTVQHVIEQYGTPAGATDLAGARTTQVKALAAADSFLGAINTDLTRLLQTRIDALFSRLISMLSVAAGLVLVVLAASVLAATSILRTIKQLVQDITAVAEERADATIRHAINTDEIGAVARAAAYLRDCTVERLQVAQQVLQSEQDAAALAAQNAADARIANQQVAARNAEQQAAVVQALSMALRQLASGNLDCTIDQSFEGDLEAVRNDFNRTVSSLTQVIGGLRQTSSLLKTATSEILSGANDLSERTTKQAASIEETSAAIEQVAHIGKSNAEQALRAEHQAGTAATLADEGGAVMHNANAAMQRITASSSRISDIIGLIDDIAFQTNLLALNASVEAARAGDAGKGFAVVAVEVRRLAQSAASASSDIKQLIEQSVGEVTTGSRLVSDASAKLTIILEAVQQNNALMKSIACASREQASAIGEVTMAIRQMDEMTQHNAALVEETNAAIEQTQARASELDAVVDRFRLPTGAATTLRAA